MRTYQSVLGAVAVVSIMVTVGSGPSPRAQQRFEYVGPNQCLNCHDHSSERDWYQGKELLEVQRIFPDKGKNAGHINSLQQMEAPKSDDFAKAIGLADKYDVNGACVGCHATVFGGDANAGVSCESCHGPGSGYLKPHQTQGSYEISVSQYGMTPLLGNLKGWTQQCTNCHVMNDQRLIDAGHPSGDTFDLSKKYAPVSVHFKKTYQPAEVDVNARSQMAGILARRRPGSAPAPTAGTGGVPAGGGVSLAAPPPPPPPPPPPAASTAAPRPTPKPAPPPPPEPPAVDPNVPPPGSPTSIEPPPPLTSAPPPVAAPPPAPAAAPDTTTSEGTGLNLPVILIGGAIVVVIGLLVVLRRKK